MPTANRKMSISEAVPRLLEIVAALRAAYPGRKFTLDGRLVGDLGEVLAAEHYDLDLLPELTAKYDGETSDGRSVQVKATMRGHLTFPADHVPDYYLGLHIHPDGSFKELFNGPGAILAQALAGRKRPKNNQLSLAAKKLRELSGQVPDHERVPGRRARG